ncbi:hypothetical protein O181_038316 [Austropuccinia psidii MF-1]|uniref:Protein farnesyltransferase/geranylgeranyltransferase type-1 subunit alpha n=1 Tax=Austropuccinia psidii MF-1 TaxID=1389203 RepID=A0A9Q3D7S5_9BASI|nr:hypothetical protein [Austropuccinia psidii MF-1]
MAHHVSFSLAMPPSISGRIKGMKRKRMIRSGRSLRSASLKSRPGILGAILRWILSVAFFIRLLLTGRLLSYLEPIIEMLKSFSIVEDHALWQDLTPLPQADTERPMVQIAYDPMYRKAMDLFRALVHANETSERALRLTTAILQHNPSHYSVWSYRCQVLKALHKSSPGENWIQKELEFLNKALPKQRKTYQIWQHRLEMIKLTNDISKEIDLINSLIEVDSKNYHTWTYRQTILSHYNQPEMWIGELPFNEKLLNEDIRNNSAWNHRFFIVFDAAFLQNPALTTEEFNSLVSKEIEFTKSQIHKAPNNPSAWNYLRGILKRGRLPLSLVQDFVIPLTKTAQVLTDEDSWPIDLNKQADLPVVGAIEFLADIYAASPSSANDAINLYNALAQKFDPIRHGYWQYRVLMANRQQSEILAS